ncbi:hypothetical protein AAVH_26592, partial [Aphelenchoides avenae]
ERPEKSAHSDGLLEQTTEPETSPNCQQHAGNDNEKYAKNPTDDEETIARIDHAHEAPETPDTEENIQ